MKIKKNSGKEAIFKKNKIFKANQFANMRY